MELMMPKQKPLARSIARNRPTRWLPTEEKVGGKALDGEAAGKLSRVVGAVANVPVDIMVDVVAARGVAAVALTECDAMGVDRMITELILVPITTAESSESMVATGTRWNDLMSRRILAAKIAMTRRKTPMHRGSNMVLTISLLHFSSAEDVVADVVVGVAAGVEAVAVGAVTL
jgi:hypothetical protein